MNIDALLSKAKDEKYFNSLRYLSHNLGDKRNEFIAKLSAENIYLAAQCAMSCQVNEKLERYLVEKAVLEAQDYETPIKSASAFLALAEMEQNEAISNLLEDNKDPGILRRVFVKMFIEKKEVTFLLFLEILIKLNRFHLINMLLYSYKEPIKVDKNNREIIYKLVEISLARSEDQYIKSIFIKFEILNNIEYIYGKNINLILNNILIKHNKKIVAYEIANYYNAFGEFDRMHYIDLFMKSNSFAEIIFAYNIALKNNLLDRYPPRMFVDKLLSFSSSIRNGKKNLKLLFSIVTRHQLGSINEINSIINKLSISNSKKARNMVKRFINAGMIEYINQSGDENLEKELVSLTKKEHYKNSTKNIKEKTYVVDDVFFTNIPNEIVDLNICKFMDKVFIENITEKVNIDNFLKYILIKYAVDLKAVSHMLRKFQFTGMVKAVMEYGVFVEANRLESSKLFFLHKTQISEHAFETPSDVLKTGDIIKFRIIGINPDTMRFNISCLPHFDPSLNKY